MNTISKALILFVVGPSLAALAQQQQPNVIPTNLPGVTTIAAPPAGFNPLTASDSDLQYYGFPPRPDQNADAKGYSTWAKAMAASTNRIVPNLVQTSIAHGPVQLVKGSDNSNSVDEASVKSYNWSGYANLGGSTKYKKSTSFYYIISDFVVPQARQAFGACTGSWDYGSSWVGIDGYNSSDVLQAGVEFDALCSGGTNYTFYSPWYEWFPYDEVRISNLAIAPGDDYFVEVWNTTSTQGYAYLVNENAGTAVEIGFTAPSGTTLEGNSAEWITERPGVNGSLATLTNYIAEPYWNADAYNWSDKKFTPGGSHGVAITMLDDNGKPISYPSLEDSSAFLAFDEGSAY